MRPPVNRRRQSRHVLTFDPAGRAEFGYPDPGGHPCSMPLRDMSASGLSIVLAHEMPGLEAGSRLDGATIRVGKREFRADLLVMHVTPGPSEGAVCGALVYPAEDSDLLTMREVIADLEARSAAPEATEALG
jgi:hypothetical protein